MNRRSFLFMLVGAVSGPLLTGKTKLLPQPHHGKGVVRTDFGVLQEFYGTVHGPTNHYRFREWHSTAWLPSMIDGKVV